MAQKRKWSPKERDSKGGDLGAEQRELRCAPAWPCPALRQPPSSHLWGPALFVLKPQVAGFSRRGLAVFYLFLYFHHQKRCEVCGPLWVSMVLMAASCLLALFPVSSPSPLCNHSKCCGLYRGKGGRLWTVTDPGMSINAQL